MYLFCKSFFYNNTLSNVPVLFKLLKMWIMLLYFFVCPENADAFTWVLFLSFDLMFSISSDSTIVLLFIHTENNTSILQIKRVTHTKELHTITIIILLVAFHFVSHLDENVWYGLDCYVKSEEEEKKTFCFHGRLHIFLFILSGSK